MGFITKLEDVKEEARILALLDHPRCLKLKEVLDSNQDSADGKVYFITSFMPGGELMILKDNRDDNLERSCLLESNASAALPADATQDTLREKFVPQLKTMWTSTEAQAKCFIRDVAEGLEYLHEDLGICHRDLKVDNLLLGADGRVCVGDFGRTDEMSANGKVRYTKGTYMFMAPECLRPVDESKAP